jgi:hypothetical protein
MIGEPDAGNPHVRFDEGTQETGGDVPRLRPTLQSPQVITLLRGDSRAIFVPKQRTLIQFPETGQ